jgi:hypothetical protein
MLPLQKSVLLCQANAAPVAVAAAAIVLNSFYSLLQQAQSPHTQIVVMEQQEQEN